VASPPLILHPNSLDILPKFEFPGENVERRYNALEEMQKHQYRRKALISLSMYSRLFIPVAREYLEFNLLRLHTVIPVCGVRVSC